MSHRQARRAFGRASRVDSVRNRFASRSGGNVTCMDTLEKAVEAHRRAVIAEKAARDALYGEIWRARQSGVSQVEVVRRTGYTREHVRRIERLFERSSD